MSTKGLNLNTTLLPRGFEDVLPPEAQDEAFAIQELMATFSGFGFVRVKPPFLEFEDSLFAPGPGAALVDQSFRVMDPISHKMMGLRSDVTAQIARIASSRMKAEPRPLRLAYANDVLRTKASQHRTLRQFCQVGCEIIGDADMERDIEACVMAIMGLKRLKIKKITVDLVYPSIVRRILDGLDLDENARSVLDGALEKRDLNAVQNLPGAVSKVLQGFMKSAGPAERGCEKLESLVGDLFTKEDMEELQAFYNGVKKAMEELAFEDVTITLDLLENKLFEYHNGVAFTVFADGARGELGCGGRYDIAGGEPGQTETATGFTLYMDTIRKVMPAREQVKVIRVNPEESWAIIHDLQQTGWQVVRQKDDGTYFEYVYEGGIIQSSS